METVDIVNDQNIVIGQIPKDRLYDGPNNHRIVHVLIFSDRGELALQRRSQTVSFLPGYWTTVVGGHVQTGESSERAAKREMKEEIGIDVPIKKLFETVYEPPHVPGMKKFLTVFRARHNGPFPNNSADVERVEFFSLNKILELIDHGKNVHHEMAEVMCILINRQKIQWKARDILLSSG